MTATKELLESLHAIVGKELLARIKSGEASASDFAQAIKFLSDNDISAVNNPNVAALGNFLGKMPFSDTDDPTTPSAH